MTVAKKLTANILFVDDRETAPALKQQLGMKSAARLKVLHPQDVESEDIQKASLIMVDYQLDSWSERDNASALALKPVDGLALAAVLRQRAQSQEGASPCAFAILTGEIERLAGSLPPEYREHALARINNLEWVFQKNKVNITQIIDLAAAVKALPAKWSSLGDNSLSQLMKLLGVREDDKYHKQLIEDVENALPPSHELSEWSHGLTLIRWLLHRILPYPCFLWDSFHLAARLRIQQESLIANQRLINKLRDCRYKGILSEFLGPRWWRSKVESLLWELTNGNSSDIVTVLKAVSKVTTRRSSFTVSSVEHPIVCVNSHYQPLEQFASIKDAVRIRPDDWPAFADQAWTTIDLAKSEPRLRAVVIREDIPKLQQ